MRFISVSAACRDLAKGPSDEAVMTALEDGLPKTLLVERRLNEAPAGDRQMRSGASTPTRHARFRGGGVDPAERVGLNSSDPAAKAGES